MVMSRSERKPYGPGELLVRTVGCGVCSGDVFAYTRRRELAEGREERLGHEGNGIVEEVGEGVTGVKPGDAVTSLWGAYAEYFVSPAKYAVKLPDNLDPKWALGEPLSCMVHAMNRMTVGPRDRAAIVGCGFMGNLCLQILKSRGAGHICAVDTIPERREQALACGADEAFAPEEVPLHEDPHREGTFDAVVEAAGVQPALDLCGSMVKQHGLINMIAGHQSEGGMRTVNMYQWNWKAITVYQGHVRRREEKREALRQSVELMASGAVDMRPLVSFYPLEEADQAFRDLINRKPGLYKAVLVP
jgi:threonine dehydrogenase-like Zn-dependent dehydrogenase